MVADNSSTIQVVFKGQTQSLQDGIKTLNAALNTLTGTLVKTNEVLAKQAVEHKKVEQEARGMTRGIEVAADAMALLSKESSEATRRLYEVRSLASDMRGAFKSMHGAILGGVTAFAGVAALGFLHSAVEEGLAGERAQAQLNAALKNNKDAIEATNKATEEGASTWARYGVTVGQLKGIMAGALGRGIAPEQILQNSKGISDLAVALHTDMGRAIDAITNGPRSLKALGRALNLNQMDLVSFNLKMQQARTEAGRFQVALDYISKSRFAGQGAALANTDTGKMLQFQTSVKDLEETLGTNLIPLLGNFANALNGIVQTANTLLAGFGGLSGVLSSKWVPIIALSLVGLKAFHGIVTMIEGLLHTKFISTLLGMRQTLNQDTGAAEDLTAAIKGIPTDVTTVATFDDAAAVAVKEPYIANVRSVPTAVTTTATFIPATIPAEPALQPITVPVTYDTSHALTEATPTPLSVPVTYDTSRAFSEAVPTPLSVPVTYDTTRSLTEATPRPIAIPVTYDTANAVPESVPKPLSVPVTYDTTKPLVESAPHPIKVPVIYAGALTEAHGSPIKIPVIYQGTLHESATHPEHVKVIYDGSLSETQSHPVKVPVIYQGTFHEAGGHPLHIPVVYDDTHKINISGTEHVTPQLAGDAQKTLQTELNAHGPVTVRVRPQWISNAAEGLRQGIAGGVAFGIADAVFNGSVVIKHATIPTVHLPTPTVSGHGGVVQVAIFEGPRQPLPVRVVNPGAIGSALPGGKVPTGPMHVQIDGHPYVGLVANQSLKVSNFPASIGATKPTGSTVTMPNTIKARQEGPWTVSLSPDAIGRFMQMVGEIAIGSALGNIFGGLGIGPLKGLLGKLNKGKGTGGGTTGGGGSDSPVSVPLAEDEVLAEAQQYLRGIKAPAPGPNTPLAYHKGNDPVVTAVKNALSTAIPLGIAAIAPATLGKALGDKLRGAISGISVEVLAKGGALVGIGGAFIGLVANVIKGAALAGGGALGGAETAVVSLFAFFFKGIQQAFQRQLGSGGGHGPAISAINFAPLIGSLGTLVVQGMIDGVKSASGALASIGKTIITTLMQGIRNALPGPVQGAFDNLTHNAYKPHKGHGGPTDTGRGNGGGWTGGGGGASGLTNVSPSLAAQLSAMTGLHVPTSAAAARAGGHTGNVTINQYINGAHDPHAVAQQAGIEARKALQEFVQAL